MVLMALDHVRDFFHVGAMTFSPEDLTRTTTALFLTRWITHIRAPVFMFAAGTGAFLRLQRDGSKARLSRYLWTRGVWLIVLELTVMRLGLNFTADPRYPVLLMVLWALGLSMVALAALVHLPARVLAVLSVAVICLHNTLDGIQASSLGSFAPVWNVLHQQGAFTAGGLVFVVAYPVLPWIAVMAAGYCFGPVLLMEPARKRRVLRTTGAALILAFAVLRALNVYGDPAPWSPQPSAAFTILSFLRTTKYPPSLEFLLMTLGPAALLLWYFERRGLRQDHPLVVIGRVPLFFFVVHFWAIHALASFMAWLRYGADSLRFLFSPLPSMGGARELFPAGFGYQLATVYVVWIGIVVGMYPLCRWFADVKARRKDWWLGYF